MGTGLKRTTIFLTEDLREGLRRLAIERRTSMARLLREAGLQSLEDAEDMEAGLGAISDEEGTLSWEEYQRRRRERRGSA